MAAILTIPGELAAELPEDTLVTRCGGDLAREDRWATLTSCIGGIIWLAISSSERDEEEDFLTSILLTATSCLPICSVTMGLILGGVVWPF